MMARADPRWRWVTNLQRSEVEEYRKAAGIRVVVGPPRRTKELAAGQLEEMGMVGVYATGARR